MESGHVWMVERLGSRSMKMGHVRAPVMSHVMAATMMAPNLSRQLAESGPSRSLPLIRRPQPPLPLIRISQPPLPLIRS